MDPLGEKILDLRQVLKIIQIQINTCDVKCSSFRRIYLWHARVSRDCELPEFRNVAAKKACLKFVHVVRASQSI